MLAVTTPPAIARSPFEVRPLGDVTHRSTGPTDQPFLNRRAEALVGRMFTLEKPIIGGVGAISVDDMVWRVRGDDIPAGSRVKVTRVDGVTIYVERIMG